MGLETATYISDLNSSNPTAGDLKSQGDDHIRLVKSTVKATFPNVSGAVTPTHTELNYVDGVTSAVQTQIDAKAALASPTFTGVPAAPTAAAATNSTQLATTAFVQGEIAAVNAQSGVTLSINSTASISAAAGTHYVVTNAGAVTVTLPTGPAAGSYVWVTVGNDRTDNVIAQGGSKIMSLAENLTINNRYATVQLRYINSTIGWTLV